MRLNRRQVYRVLVGYYTSLSLDLRDTHFIPIGSFSGTFLCMNSRA